MASERFSDTDAWLLLSVLMASGKGPASLRDILSVGDYLNHALLKYKEVAGGTKRLVQARILKQVGGGFSGTAGFLRLCRQQSDAGRSVTEKFAAAERLMDIWPPGLRRGKLRRPITREQYAAAQAKYLEDFWRTAEKRPK